MSMGENLEGNNGKKKTKAELAEEQYWIFIQKIRSLPLLKCPYCQFKSVYKEVIEHHTKYTHIKGHPSPPNVRLPFMCRKEILDWEDAMANRNKRRSWELNLECNCPTNPMNWPIAGKECTCIKDEYKCEAHPRIDNVLL